MERIFWVECPKCADRFCCDYELRHSKYKLICPFCSEQFLESESPEIDERL
ncbi:MAG: hypothetical protein Q7J85_11565 [Bacillota bacterium]|nr:hypothetical protein [Bacillota bacterium]